MDVKVDPIFSLRLLLQACVGVLIGTLLAMVLSAHLWPVGGRYSDVPDGMLAWNMHNVLFKPREKGFYLLSLLFGVAGAYLATARIYLRPMVPLICGLAVSIPIVIFFAGQVLQKNSMVLLLLMFVMICMIICAVLLSRSESVCIIASKINAAPFPVKPYFILLGVMSLLLLPSSFTILAARIGMEMHVVSFIIGPALYFLADHLLPGLDYFTQYSLGMGWIFVHFLGTSVEQTMVNYARFVILAIWLFYAQMLAVLIWLYRSWVPAAFVVLLALIMLFHTKVHFFDPSSSILRYPLMGVCAAALAWWVQHPYSVLRNLMLSVTLAFSVFLNTETGIIFCVAAVVARIFTGQKLHSSVLELIVLGSMSLCIFVTCLISVFGIGVLQLAFLLDNIQPLLIFGKLGQGGWPIHWSMVDLNWFYNVVVPGIAVATLGLIIRTSKKSHSNTPRMAVLAFFCVSGLLMLAKYVNMAIVGVWQVNALGLLVPLAWWAQVVYQHGKKYSVSVPMFAAPVSSSTLALVIFTAGSLWLGALSNDSRNPSEYGLMSWLRYPSYIRGIIRHPEGCIDFSCVDNRPAEKDVALIRELTKPGEQVAIIDLFDWTYLVNAHRPPLMSFVPSSVIFTKKQMEDSLSKLERTAYLFLPKDGEKPNVPHPPELRSAMLPTFLEHYELAAVGEKLAVWKRKQVKEKLA